MSRIIDAINKLNDVAGLVPATKAEIINAERELGLHFDDEYKEVLENFGAVMSDNIELIGISSSKRLDVVNVTKREKQLNLEISDNMYVIENIGVDGALMLQSVDGEIFITKPGLKPIKKFDSLSSFVESLIESV